LYGLYELRQLRQDFSSVLVVEGYTDVVSLSVHGVNNAVASLGTALTPEQIQKLYKYTSKITLVFDGDRAGIDAAKRALQNALPYVNDVKSLSVVFMPKGEDPDNLVKTIGEEGFRKFLGDNEVPLSRYLFEICKGDEQKGTQEYRAGLGKRYKDYLLKMTDSILREQLYEKLAIYLSVNRDSLSKKSCSQASSKKGSKRKFSITPSRTACYAMLCYPDAVRAAKLDEVCNMDLGTPGYMAIKEIFSHIVSISGEISTPVLLESLKTSAHYSSYCKVLLSTIQVLEDQAEQIIIDCVEKEIDKYLKAELDRLVLKRRDIGLDPNEESTMLSILTRNKVA